MASLSVYTIQKLVLKTAIKLKKNSPNKAKKKKNQFFFEIWRFLKAKKKKGNFTTEYSLFCFDLSHFGVIWGKRKKRWKATQ
jgi:hypothetical protein